MQTRSSVDIAMPVESTDSSARRCRRASPNPRRYLCSRSRSGGCCGACVGISEEHTRRNACGPASTIKRRIRLIAAARAALQAGRAAAVSLSRLRRLNPDYPPLAQKNVPAVELNSATSHPASSHSSIATAIRRNVMDFYAYAAYRFARDPLPQDQIRAFDTAWNELGPHALPDQIESVFNASMSTSESSRSTSTITATTYGHVNNVALLFGLELGEHSCYLQESSTGRTRTLRRRCAVRWPSIA